MADFKQGLTKMLTGNPMSGIGMAGGPMSGMGMLNILGDFLGNSLGKHDKHGGDDAPQAPAAPQNPGQKMFGMGPGSDAGLARPPVDDAHHKNFGGRLLDELFKNAIGGFR